MTPHPASSLKKNQALLVTSLPNIYYYSGIHTDGVFLLFTKSKKFVFTDARFIKGAATIARGFIPVATDKKNTAWWRDVLKKNNIKTVYFEPLDLTYSRLQQFRTISRSSAQLKPAVLNLQTVRAKKTAHELRYLKKAARIASDIMFTVTRQFMRKNSAGKLTEHDVVLEIYKQALQHGCTHLSFPPIVAFGTHAGIPHHQSSRSRKLRRGDMILIDMGVLYQQYCSDITRTFFTAPPTSRQINIYQKVLTAQKNAIALIKPRVSAQKLYTGVYDFFDDLAPHFTHGLGHGVGLEIHELPNLKPNNDDRLAVGQVVTVEPGLYFSWGGVRIEDMVEVINHGHKVLTQFPKEIKDVMLY